MDEKTKFNTVADSELTAISGGGGYTKYTTTYTVQAGDCLSTIANNCGTTVDILKRLNPSIPANNTIYVGQIIIVAFSKVWG